jgi:NhaP-type Na+/H+ and K+/H+ antiporter
MEMTMPDNVSIFFGVVFFIVGAALLLQGQSSTDVSESATTVAGAAFLSLGSIVLWAALRNWWGWRKELKRFRNG